MANKEDKPKDEPEPICFVIMPIADPEGYEKGHFKRVYEDIFKPACEKAGFEPIRADDVKQTNLIHLDILQKLIHSPMAICDLSSRNPNVLFELGLRQAFDKPTVLVQEVGTPKIFDISPLRYSEYRKELKYREVLEDQDSLAETIRATKEATDKGEGVNSIVSLLSLTNPASLKEVTDSDSTKMLQVIMSEMSQLRSDIKSRIATGKNIDIGNGLVWNEKLWNNYFKKIEKDYNTFRTLVNENDLPFLPSAEEGLKEDIMNDIKFLKSFFIAIPVNALQSLLDIESRLSSYI